MKASNKQTQRTVTRWHADPLPDPTDRLTLIAEEPLSIRVQGQPFVVVMRTPGDEKEHAAGLCLAEGIIDTPDDITNLSLCDGPESNTVTVTLSKTAAARFRAQDHRRAHISQTGCGLCGKELILDLYQNLQPVPDGPVIASAAAAKCLLSIDQYQPLRAATRAAHAAALFDRQGQFLTVAEDVGRHSALDKSIGRLFLGRQLSRIGFLVLSSRISYELVQKAARARIPVILANSRPTALAVALAEGLNITLATKMPGGGGLFIFTGNERLRDTHDPARPQR
ncbi:MAG: formate dehydrogenase accessory sulfurtransferase FdhD [Desulfosarcina sp.]|nr:formate dehydrogenase accessory sulfurtransferase FdhD [Desulfobacterales bacterium]